jgi:hypothetical protein
MNILSTVFGGGKTITKALDLAKEYVEDKDKRNELAVEIIRIQAKADSVSTVPWVDAVHKMGRQLLWFCVIGFYVYSWNKGKPIDLETLALLAGGPGLYTLMKGKGR